MNEAISKMFDNFSGVYVSFKDIDAELIHKLKIEEIEKNFTDEEIKEAIEFYIKHKIDYYIFLCSGCNKKLIVDMLLAGLIQFQE